MKPIVVPQFEELSPKKIYSKIKRYCPEISEYLPEYAGKDFNPQKKFMWDIFSTLDSELAHEFIKYSISLRSEEEKEGDRTIEISDEILNDLKSVNYFSKKKGKALFMLKSNKDYTQINRKRRREYDSFDPQQSYGTLNPGSRRIKVAEGTDMRVDIPRRSSKYYNQPPASVNSEGKSHGSDMEVAPTEEKQQLKNLLSKH